ncbi:MAG TPA: LytR C-terminal domain-containing protein [Acidimicrobiales bacterium]|nr:LytR C-terminal domain-containing protein [Acidimicrobiales bacterium]
MTHTSSEPGPGSHFQPATVVMLLLVALFIGSAFLILRAHSPASTSSTTTTTTTTTPGHHSTTRHPPRARVTVQVANGTNTANLAHDYTQKLLTLGWDALSPVNASSRAAATVIFFNPGYKWAALVIASEVKVSASAVQALGGANPAPGAKTDDVVVVLGPDVAVG